MKNGEDTLSNQQKYNGWKKKQNRRGSKNALSPQQIVRKKYFTDGTFSPVRLGQDIIDNHMKVFTLGHQLYRYDQGVYKPGGIEAFNRIATTLLDVEFKSHRVKEALQWVMTMTRIDDDQQVNPNDGLINVANGLLNWKTGKLSHHTPDRLSTIQLPVVFDSEANDRTVMNFISSVIPQDTIDTIFEMIGYFLMPHTDYEKAFLLYGQGGNGKSTLINMISAMIGEENMSSVSLQDLEQRFRLALLHNKLVNKFADLPRNALPNSSNFKAVVSGDAMTGEFKNRDPFQFRPYAKLLFSTNELPKTADKTQGYYRRWIIIPFEKTFSSDADVRLHEKLTSPSALSTLLNHTIVGMRRLSTNGRFTESDTMKNAMQRYRLENDNVAKFIEECCVLGEDESFMTKPLYESYVAWSKDSGYYALGKGNFHKRLEADFALTKKRIKGETCERWIGVSLRLDQ